MTAAAEPHSADLRLQLPLERYPGMNPLALDLIRGEPRAARFYSARRGGSPQPAAPDVDRSGLATALAESNRTWGNDVEAAVQAWASGASAAIIAGQQVGFGGGPLLVLNKIASLLRCRDELAARGRQATAFFWLATEDHDFAEVAQIALAGADGLHRIASSEHVPARHVVGSLPIPEDLRTRLLAEIGTVDGAWLREGITFRDSFASLLAEVFAADNLVLVDSLLPELRSAGRGLFRSILSKREEIGIAINTRSDEIRQAGYVPQVLPGGDGEYTLLYLIQEGVRHPLRAGNEALFTEAIDARPESISTGALARPLLQDLVFAPEVFIGGPSEVAYYAQITPLHEMFGISRPRVALRGHLLIAPGRFLRSAAKFGLKPEEILDDPTEVIGRRERPAIESMRSVIDGTARNVDAALQQARSEIVGADPGWINPWPGRYVASISISANFASGASERRSGAIRNVLRLLKSFTTRSCPAVSRRIAWLPGCRGG